MFSTRSAIALLMFALTTLSGTLISCTSELKEEVAIAPTEIGLNSNSGSYDLSSDEGIAAAYLALTGSALDSEEACLKPVRNFDGVALIGSFAHDIGCVYSEAIVMDEVSDIRGLTPKALLANGWEDASNRELLALDWVRRALLPTHDFPNEDDPSFKREGTPPYSAPTTELSEDGGVIVAIWAQEPADDQPIDRYGYYTARFSPEGTILSTQFTDQFEVEIIRE